MPGKPPYMSRSKRAAQEAGGWRTLAQQLRDLKEEHLPEGYEDSTDPELLDKLCADVVKDAKAIVENYSTAELENLLEELRTWRDNLPDNLQSSSKAEALDDAISEMENIDDSYPEINSVEDIEPAADELDERADTLEGVTFPTMFG